jgi:hypothetical protein
LAKIVLDLHDIYNKGFTIDAELNRVIAEAIKTFIDYYNYKRYHEGLSNVTPYVVYIGRHLEIIQKRKKGKSKTSAERRSYNRTARRKSNAS